MQSPNLQPGDFGDLASNPPRGALSENDWEGIELHNEAQKVIDEQRGTTTPPSPAAESAKTFLANMPEIDRVERSLKAEENVTARDAFNRFLGVISTPPPFRGVVSPFPPPEGPSDLVTHYGGGEEGFHRPVNNPTHQVPLVDPQGNPIPPTQPETPQLNYQPKTPETSQILGGQQPPQGGPIVPPNPQPYPATSPVITTEGYTARAPELTALFNELQAALKRAGRSLQSGGLGDIPDILAPLAKIGLYHLKNGATDFASWASAMRDSASKLKVQVTDEDLRKMWGNAAFTDARSKAVAMAAANTGVAQPVAQVATQLTPDDISRTQIRTSTNGALHQVLNFMRPQMWDVVQKDAPGVGQAATTLIQSRSTAALMAKHDFDPLKDILADNGNNGTVKSSVLNQRLNNFVRLLWDYRGRSLDLKKNSIEAERAGLAQQIEALKDSTDDDAGLKTLKLQHQLEELKVPPNHRVPILDPTERQKLLADPNITKAVQWYDKVVAPRIRTQSEAAGIPTRLGVPNEPDLYARMDWKPDTDGRVFRGGGSSGSPSPFDVRPQKSRSARAATGAAPDTFKLPDNLEQILYDTYEARTTTAAKNALINEVEKVSLGSKLDFNQHGETTPSSDEADHIYIQRGFTTKDHFVPKGVGQAFELATRPSGLTLMDNKAVQIASAIATAPTIAMPADALNHSLGFIGTAGRYRWGNTWGTQAFETLGGIYAKQLIAIKRAWSYSGPEFTQKLEDWNNAGLFRSQGFSNLQPERSLFMKAAGALDSDALGKVGKVTGFIKHVAFGHPGYDTGLWGLETRYKLACAEALQDMDPTLNKAQAAQMVNNVQGTYVNKLVPQLAQYMSPATPFARARVALPKSAVNYMVGRDATGNYNLANHLNAAWSTAIATILLTKTLDSQHRWPWEIPHWSPRRPVVIGNDDGSRVEIPASVIFNPGARAMQVTGVNNAIEDYVNGQRSPVRLGLDMARGLANHAMSFFGPAASTTMIGSTGMAPYVTSKGEFENPQIPTMTGAKFGPGRARLRAMLEQWLPQYGRASDLFDSYNPLGGGNSGKEVLPQDPTWKVAYGVGKWFGVSPLLRAKGFEDQPATGQQAMTQAEFQDVFYKTLGQANNIPENKREQWVRDRIDQNFSDAMVQTLQGPKPANVAAQDLYKLIYTQAARQAKKAALNQANVAH